MIDTIRRVGWIAAEIGLILVVLAVLLHVILGEAGGSAVTAIANNTVALLQSLPPGTIVGLAALAGLYLLLRSRLKP
jgi:hypothetical protein